MENLAGQQVFNVYNICRVILALILITGFYFRSFLGNINSELFVQVVIFYLAFNVIVLFREFMPKNKALLTSQYISVILIDIVFLVLISYACSGVSSGMENLLIVPISSGRLLTL